VIILWVILAAMLAPYKASNDFVFFGLYENDNNYETPCGTDSPQSAGEFRLANGPRGVECLVRAVLAGEHTGTSIGRHRWDARLRWVPF
jgi:hypothetical protein